MSKKLKIGIVGFGERGYSFALPIQNEKFSGRAEVAAVCELDPLKRGFAQDAVHNPMLLTDSLTDFLKQELDLVLVTVPQFAHASIAVAALEAGKNVFVDKPMACTTAECLDIMRAEKRAAGQLFMGFNLRHHPLCRKINEWITSGRAGFVQQQTCMDFYGGGYSYFRRWHRFAKNSGGLTVEKGCHSIDLLNMFAGSTPVRVAAFAGLNRFVPNGNHAQHCSDCPDAGSCVYFMDMARAEEQTKINTGIDAVKVNGGAKLDLCVFNTEKDTCDNTNVIIEYANGARAALSECFTSSVPQKSDRTFILNCWNGQIWGDLLNNHLQFFANTPGRREPAPCEDLQIPEAPGNHGGADWLMLEHMLDCIAAGRRNNTMLSLDGYYAVAVGEAAEIAARENRVVEIQPPQL